MRRSPAAPSPRCRASSNLARLRRRTTSNYGKVHSNLGTTLNELERYDEAETHLRRAIELDSKTMHGHRHLGYALYEQGRYEEALDAYLIAVEQHPDDPTAHSNLGAALALDKLKRYDEAETHLRRAIELNPGYTLHFRAALRADQQRYDEMLEFLQWLIDIDPDDPEAHLNMGLALSHLGRSDEALRSFDRATFPRPGPGGRTRQSRGRAGGD